ncbi:MAG: hypothetical protein WC166_04335 [Bacteroidales bacterium]
MLERLAAVFVATTALLSCSNKQAFSAKDFFVEHIADIENLWTAEGKTPLPDRFALIDIDGDGCEELYLYNNNSDDGMLLCCGGEQLQTIAIQDYRSEIKVNGNKIQCGGGVGTGVQFFEGYELNNSQVEASYSVYLEYGPFGEKQIYEGKYGKGEADAKAFFDTMNDSQPLRNSVEWQDYALIQGAESHETKVTTAATEEIVTISDIFLALPDSIVGTREERQQMLEGGKTLNKEEMSYDGEKYPNCVAVAEGNYLYLYNQFGDGIWEMCYFNNPNDKNFKTVLITSRAVITNFLYQYRYFADSETFEPITTDLDVAKFDDLANEGIFVPKHYEQGRTAFNNAQQSWGNSMVYYDLSLANDNRVILSISDIILDIAGLPFDMDRTQAFPKVAYNWDGWLFIKQHAGNS